MAERTTQLLLPDVLRRFAAGAGVSFGPIRVSREGGLQLFRAFGNVFEIPWEALTGYRVRRGFLFLSSTGKLTRRAAARRIPNVFVLLALFDHLRAQPGALTPSPASPPVAATPLAPS